LAISNPVSVFNAKNNIEAHLLQNMLADEGIEAYATFDESAVGHWMFGSLPEIHKPQVWIDRSNVDQARPLLMKFEQRQRLHSMPAKGSADREGDKIAVICEECGKTSYFGGSKNGTVQDCPHCGAYVDVEDGESQPFDS
jgi:endogenous inhibitor of DNA gyrase (YacG/DUF329 family)